MGAFLTDCIRTLFRGSPAYRAAMLIAGLFALVGAHGYYLQLTSGLGVTGMHDLVPWGVYISNFAYLVGVSGAALMIVLPAYVFHRDDARHLVLIAHGLAAAAAATALLFVFVDIGHPERALLLMTNLFSGKLPSSMLAWDVVAIPGYLLINTAIPAYVLYRHYRGRHTETRVLWPAVLVMMCWSVALLTEEAFLFASAIARPLWHSPLLVPRFIAAAFASGTALLLVVLSIMRGRGLIALPEGVVRMQSLIIAASLQANLLMVGSEAFTGLYRPTEHGESVRYLLMGTPDDGGLVPVMWLALGMQGAAALTLMFERLRNLRPVLWACCAATVVGLWLDKGLSFVVAGFVPGPFGEISSYVPTWVETQVSMGIWAIGAIAFMALARVALAVEHGEIGRGRREIGLDDESLPRRPSVMP